MYTKAILKYFLDVNLFNIAFCLVIGTFVGFFWSIITFSSFGVFFGLFGFKTFKNNEYYTYYNIGLTKTYLLKRVLMLNLCISILVFLIYLIIA